MRILKEADASRPVNDVWRQDGTSPATHDKQKTKYSGLAVSYVKCLGSSSTTGSKACTPTSRGERGR
ncbi:transposase (fragment) [Candidatus Nitrospira inopinata]|uniref:Transposase n=1 Tax=Candidatus Nitrospira inopinata TaxID=1715989 RepID=A0A0S4KSG4_9BACT